MALPSGKQLFEPAGGFFAVGLLGVVGVFST